MTIKAKAKPQDGQPFEKSLERLEDIVRQLEGGEKSLEDSLKLFEEGASLSKLLTQRLEEVKGRVEVLVKDGGRFKAKALEDADAEG